MGRKGETTEKTTSSGSGNGKGQGKRRRGDKTQAVKAALAKGMASPSEIAKYLGSQGIQITPGHVTTIKVKLKREAAEPEQSNEGVSEHQPEAPAREQIAQPAARKTTPIAGIGLLPEDLTTLADIAERAGGIERLQEFLSALRRIR